MIKVIMIKDKKEQIVKVFADKPEFENRNNAYDFAKFKNEQAWENGDKERYFVIE